MPLFPLLAFLALVSGSTCLVSSCEAFLQDQAFSFSCASRDACMMEIARHFDLIVPSDVDVVLADFSVRMFNHVIGPVCSNSTHCHESREVRTVFNEWVRVPMSSRLAEERADASLKRLDFLENTTCRYPMTAAEADAYDDKYCRMWGSFMTFESQATDRSVLFALIRERDYLGLLGAKCQIASNKEVCDGAVRYFLQQTNSKIQARLGRLPLAALLFMRPTQYNAVLFEAIRQVNSRPCTGLVYLPCIRQLIDPILSLDRTADVSVFRTAMLEAQRQLFSVTEQTRREGLTKAMDLWSLPVVKCGFHSRNVNIFVSTMSTVSCKAEQKQYEVRARNFSALSPVEWVNDNIYNTMREKAKVGVKYIFFFVGVVFFFV
jgi:hypothetical protein